MLLNSIDKTQLKITEHLSWLQFVILILDHHLNNAEVRILRS